MIPTIAATPCQGPIARPPVLPQRVLSSWHFSWHEDEIAPPALVAFGLNRALARSTILSYPAFHLEAICLTTNSSATPARNSSRRSYLSSNTRRAASCARIAAAKKSSSAGLPVPSSRRKRARECAGGTPMRFDKFSFGSIRIDGVTRDYDVVIDGDEIRKRNRSCPRQQYTLGGIF